MIFRKSCGCFSKEGIVKSGNGMQSLMNAQKRFQGGQPLIANPPPDIIEVFPNDDEFYRELTFGTGAPASAKRFRFSSNRANPGLAGPVKPSVLLPPRPMQSPLRFQHETSVQHPTIAPLALSSATTATTNFRFAGSASAQQVAPPAFTNERSLCFLTAPLGTIKQWMRYRDELQTLVEVFGVLESVRPDPKDPTVKWLKLKDGNLELDCSFCEMDRECPKLTPQQWCRCVGFVARDGHLVSASVRLATGQELKWRPTLMSASARAMYQRMARLNEL